MEKQAEIFDYVVVGSGFGGSVSAMRLAEKGYRVLVLERGKRWRDEDFPRSNWMVWKFLWLPVLRCFGIMQLSWLNGALVVRGSGVGGGSLVYASVLMEPSDELFAAPGWRDLADWKNVLRPHFETAKRMLGAATNPRLWPLDEAMKQLAEEMGCGETFRPTEVGVFFGEPGKTVPDPYFGGEGPPRAGCRHSAGCMLGCRNNAKNSLPKNYLFFAEKWGTSIRAEAQVQNIAALPSDQVDGARYSIDYRNPTAWWKPSQTVRAKNVVLSAGVLGTLDLLFRCRDVSRTLPRLSPRLGEMVRTNSESIYAVVQRDRQANCAQGVAITSIFQPDATTSVEPVRYPPGSSLMYFLDTTLLFTPSRNLLANIAKILWTMVRHPVDFINARLLPPMARRTTMLLVMQAKDCMMRLRLGRAAATLFRRGLVAEQDAQRPVHAKIDAGHQIVKAMAEKTDGVALGSATECLFNIPTVPHILGGCPIGLDAASGVVDRDLQVHNYPGMYVVDGSILPANPGVNPSLTITALAEYAMSRIPPCDRQTPTADGTSAVPVDLAALVPAYPTESLSK